VKGLSRRDQPCAAAQEVEELDGAGASFLRDRWERPGGESGAGYGITCVLEGGDLLEKVHLYPSILGLCYVERSLPNFGVVDDCAWQSLGLIPHQRINQLHGIGHSTLQLVSTGGRQRQRGPRSPQ